MSDREDILKISNTYLTEDRFFELMTKLDRIPKDSKPLNDAFSVIVEVIKPKLTPSKWLWVAFYALVVAHFAVVSGMIISFFSLPFYTFYGNLPWQVAMACMTFIWFMATTEVSCRCTDLENYLRKQLGMKRIGGFVGHYFLSPARRAVRKISKKWSKTT